MYLSKNNLYSNNHYWCQINVLSHYPLNVSEQSMSFTHHDLHQHTASEGQHNQVFTCQHEVLFLQVKHSVNTSGFSLIWNYSTVGWDVIHVILKRIFFFSKTINWIHRSSLKWNTTKTFPEATALQLPIYEQKLHYIVKLLNLSMWDRHHMWSEQMNSHSLSREECPFAITATIQIPDYIYIWGFEQWTRQFFTNPIHFLEAYWTKDCLYLAM